MHLQLVPYTEADQTKLIHWITSDTWEYFETPSPTPETVSKWCSCGYFNGNNSKSFWIQTLDGINAGLIVVFDVQDPIPRIELRIHISYRGMGIGKQALRWIADYVFTHYPKALRLEGNTREDNFAMRKTFTACGWVKEAHYRQIWKTNDGYVSSIGYALIKQDWVDGTITPVNWDDEP